MLGVVEMHEQREGAAIVLPCHLDVGGLFDGIDPGLPEQPHGLVGDNRGPIDFVAEWSLSARPVVRRVFVSSLYDDVAVDNALGHLPAPDYW